MAEERAQFIVELDATQAVAGLNQIRETEDQLLGTGSAFENQLSRIEDKAFDLHRAMAPAASSVMGLSNAFLGGSTEAGKLAMAGTQLINAFAMGGPMGVAFAGATFAIAAMSKSMDEAAANSHTFNDAMDSMLHTTIVDGDQKFIDMEKSLGALEKRFVSFKHTADEMALSEAKAEEASLQKEAVNLQGSIDRLNARTLDLARQKREAEKHSGFIFENEAASLKEQIDTVFAVINLNEAKLAQVNSQLGVSFEKVKQAQDNFNAFQEKQDAAASKKEETAEARADRLANAEADRIARADAAMEREENRQAEARDRRKEAENDAEQKALARKELQAAKTEERITAKLAREAEARARKQEEANRRVEESYDRLYGSVFESTLSNATGALDTFIQASVQGHKDAAKEAAAAFLKSEGQQLVGIGTRAIVEGGIISLNPLTPGAGAPMVAAGVAAIGIGIGMGAGGAALSPAATAGGGGSLSSAATDRGVNRSGGGGGSGGAAAQSVTIIYGAAGPAPQDTGRQVFKALQSFTLASGIGPQNIQGPQR